MAADLPPQTAETSANSRLNECPQPLSIPFDASQRVHLLLNEVISGLNLDLPDLHFQRLKIDFGTD
jgi:hypothetical protein